MEAGDEGDGAGEERQIRKIFKPIKRLTTPPRALVVGRFVGRFEGANLLTVCS